MEQGDFGFMISKTVVEMVRKIGYFIGIIIEFKILIDFKEQFDMVKYQGFEEEVDFI